MSRYRALGRDEDLVRGDVGPGSLAGAAADMVRRRDALRLQSELARLDRVGAAAGDELAALAQALGGVVSDPSQVLSAWAILESDGLGGVTVVDGVGVTTAFVVATRARIVLEQAMTSWFVAGAAYNQQGACHGLNRGANAIDVGCFSATATLSFAATVIVCGVFVVGRRA